MTLPVPSQRTWSVGDIVTAAMMNANVRDAVNYLLSPPTLIARQATAQSVASSSTPSVITLDTLSKDNYSGWNASTHTYTIPYTADYLICGQTQWAPNATGNRVVAILNGGNPLIGGTAEAFNVGGTYASSAVVSLVVPLAAGSTIQLGGWQVSGVSLNTNVSSQQSYMSIVAVSSA